MSSLVKEIRLANEKDTDSLRAIYRPIVEKTHFSFEYLTPDRSEFWKRIRKTLDHFPWLVCLIKGEVAAFAYAGHHRSRDAYKMVHRTFSVCRPYFQKRKVASALYLTLIEILKLQGYFNAYAGISLPNPESVAFHKAFGFSRIGEYSSVGYKFGKWH